MGLQYVKPYLLTDTGTRIGEAICGDDGYFAWWPDPNLRGFLSADHLREIATALDKLNADWDKEVKKASTLWGDC